MTSIHRGLIATAVLAACVGHYTASLRAQARTEPQAEVAAPRESEEFSAFAINMGALSGGGTANLILTVNRWNSQAERDDLFTLLREKGANALLDRLRRVKSVGTLRTPNSVGYDIRMALEEPGKDGGRRVLVVTDRPVGFSEATNRPPSIEYPFTVIDIQMPQTGFGQGTMSIAAKIIPAGRTVLIENYDTQPVQLNRIEARKRNKR